MVCFGEETRAPEEYDALKERVNKAKLPIVAELGESRISIAEFLGLSVGDVITLNKPVDEGLSIKVGDKLKYMGSPGTIKDRVAVQIDKIVTEGVEEFDE